MSTQGIHLRAIADAIREKEGTIGLIPARTFADRILALPVGIESPGVTLPAASTQEEQLARIAAAIRAKEGAEGPIPAGEFADRIAALEAAESLGIDWRETELPSSRSWYDIAYGNGRFVVVASSAAVAAYSDDGIHWTETPLPSSLRSPCIAYGNGKFVIIAPKYQVTMVSSDGIQWENGGPLSGAAIAWTPLGFGGSNRFVAPGQIASSSGATRFPVEYSDDGGISWKSQSSREIGVWRDIVYGGDKFVMVGDSGAYARSTYGNSWTVYALPVKSNFYGIDYGALDGENLFVAVANNSNQIVDSATGSGWTKAELPLTNNWRSMAYGAGKFIIIAYNSDAALCGQSILEWVPVTLPSVANWRKVIYGGGKFVVIAYNSNKAAYALA